MTDIEFTIRLYLTGVMKTWTDRMCTINEQTPQRYVLNALTELFDSLNKDDMELIRLRYLEHLTLPETARRCYRNEATIRRHTKPVVNQVQDILKQATEQAQNAREVD